MYDVDEGVPIPETKREKLLKRARQIYAEGNVGKSTAAKLAIAELGLWPMVQKQSAIDYLRNNILGE